jgi:mono/diheme cytochrome c family protein
VISITPFKSVVLAAALCGLLWTASARAADDATVKLYSTKCAGCHGADGTGQTTVGKVLKVRDLHDPEVQKMTDEEITTLITKGKDKMPANEKTLKPDQVKALVVYTRELMKKK